MKLAWQQISSPVVSELYCATQFDGVVLDMSMGAIATSHCILVYRLLLLVVKNALSD